LLDHRLNDLLLHLAAALYKFSHSLFLGEMLPFDGSQLCMHNVLGFKLALEILLQRTVLIESPILGARVKVKPC